MTPAGRPPRSTSSSKKSVSIRLTIEEHELLTKAAHPMYVSDWIRKLAIEKASQPPMPTAAAVALVMGALRELVDGLSPEKRAAAEPGFVHLARMYERMARQIDAYADAANADVANDDVMWRLLYKFASYIRHEKGCAVTPCTCFVAPIAVEVGTALAMGKVTSGS